MDDDEQIQREKKIILKCAMVAEDSNLSVVLVAVGETDDDRYGDVRTLVTETSLTTFYPTTTVELLFSILKKLFSSSFGAADTVY